MAETRKAVKAYLWSNGKVTAFDADGRQVPEYQDIDALEMLSRDFPDLLIEKAAWPLHGRI